MQYLKEDVKERILAAALQEFKEKGYLDASMRNIAHDAGVALGNVYRYFKNKEELFNELIDPVYDKLMSYISNLQKSTAPYISPIGEIIDIKDLILDIFKDNSVELLILMDKSKGSKFENIKENMVLIVESILKEKLLPELEEKGVIVKDPFITYVLSSTILDGVYTIMRNQEDGVRISLLIDQLINILFIDIEQRLK